MTALPKPVVHFEMIRRDPRNPLRVFPEELKSKILHDPFNEKGDTTITFSGGCGYRGIPENRDSRGNA